MEKIKAVSTAVSQVERQFGKGALMRLGESTRLAIDSIPTGCITLDLALGIGGVPKGRIIEIYGPEASGKTTLALHIIAQSQRAGGTAAFIDAEHALDAIYVRNLGVNIDELLISQPDYGEQALEIADILIRSGGVDVVVIDSVAALVPKAELEGEMGDSHVGLQARLMSQAMRKLAGSLSKSQAVAIFINQIREKVGVMYGSPEVTPGGRALKFWASVRMEIRRVESLKNGTEIVGNRTRVKVAKNKVAPPFRQVEFDIMYGKGISRTGSVLDAALALGIATKMGAWFSYGEVRLGQGRENSKQFLEEHADVCAELETKIVEASVKTPNIVLENLEDAA